MPDPTSAGGQTASRGWRGKNPVPVSSLAQYNPNRAGSLEAIWQPFYDFQTYPTTGQTQLLFFQVPNGQGGKNLAQTNMTNAGLFPAPTMFLCTGVQVVFVPGASTSQIGTAAARALNNVIDVVAVANSGYLEFSIGSKTYLRDAPIGKFAPNYTVQVFGNINGAGNTGSADVQFARAAGRYYDITPFVIPQTQNFAVTLNWPTVQTVVTAGTIGVILDGFYYRQSQ
jgi:hypothetical protein